MMIPQCIRNQILSLIDEEVKLMRECKQRELTQVHQKMMGMSSTVLLLEVFERAGHTIGEYLQSQQPDVWWEQLEKDVALILKEAGFRLVAGEFEFSIRDWMNNCGFMRTPIKFLQTLPDRLSQFVIPQSPGLPLMQPTNVSLPRRIRKLTYTMLFVIYICPSVSRNLVF
ncbi:uncharacterized protein LOC131320791 isoform X2 [Rhododendron vialii]|uniref:uncharacterized protein LOC131320791 isoform X2 n=1 Tax=Rhododendron vialii TaxID=182163 RepID=UPI00265D6268|nr:uncharacterized protein LOC131320791 isoform X2 [Rhododendron vialii]